MIRWDLNGGRRLKRTRRFKKNVKGSSKLNNDDIDTRDGLNLIANKILTNCTETRNDTENTVDICHDRDYDSRRQLGDQQNNTGIKFVDTININGDTGKPKRNLDNKSDDLSKAFYGQVKNADDSDNFGSRPTGIVTRLSRSQGSPCEFRENKPDADFFTEEPYIPSWLDLDSGHSKMDIKTVRSLGLVPKGLSMSLNDLRPEVGAHTSLTQSRDFIHKQQQQQPVIDGKRHNEMEKEYLKLKKKLNKKQNTDLNASVTNSKHVVFAGSHLRATNSETDVPLYKELFESDELGINHFRKHIHNVKVSSKRHKRALKVADVSPNRGVPKNRRNVTRFKPLYERSYSDETGSVNDVRQLSNRDGHS